MNNLIKKICPVCSSPHIEVFFELSNMPVFCNSLWKDSEAVKSCNKGNIKSAFCFTL